MINNESKIQFKLSFAILVFTITSLFPIKINAQQPIMQVNSKEQSKQAGNTIMIPRVTKSWSLTLRWIGNGKTIFSDFTIVKKLMVE